MAAEQNEFETERGFGTGLRAQLEKRRDGAGLGLAIARGLVEAHLQPVAPDLVGPPGLVDGRVVELVAPQQGARGAERRVDRDVAAEERAGRARAGDDVLLAVRAAIA